MHTMRCMDAILVWEIMWKVMHNHLKSDSTEQNDCIDELPWEKEQEPLIHALIISMREKHVWCKHTCLWLTECCHRMDTGHVAEDNNHVAALILSVNASVTLCVWGTTALMPWCLRGSSPDAVCLTINSLTLFYWEIYRIFWDVEKAGTRERITWKVIRLNTTTAWINGHGWRNRSYLYTYFDH